GYGKSLLNVMRKQQDAVHAGTEFPLTLGRDFSGTVVEVGRRVSKFKVGDQVWGALGAFRPGSHAEYTVTSQSEVSGIWILILGGSGGIGTFAVQLCKAWGMHVTTTCSADAVDLVTSLGADEVVDYTQEPLWEKLNHLNRFEYILDTLGGDATDKAAKLLSPWKNSKLVTLNFPLLRNSDELGVVPGLLKSAISAGITTLKGFQSGGSIRWAAFNPNGPALETIRHLVEKGKIRPIVYKVFPFSDVPSAYKQVSEGHLRGKVVVDFQSDPHP
ncbi:reticulon-4-interacting protein 1-like protein, mitochondrial, partial [Plakobranchus ocellatus]